MEDIKQKLIYTTNQNYHKDITGAKVKINVSKIMSRSCSTNFKKFLEESKDKIFTAELDVENNYTIMYTLKEDKSMVKWLFHIDDLIIV